MAPIRLCKECKSYRRSIRNRWKCPGFKAVLIDDLTCKYCAETAELKLEYGDNRESGKLRIMTKKSATAALAARHSKMTAAPDGVARNGLIDRDFTESGACLERLEQLERDDAIQAGGGAQPCVPSNVSASGDTRPPAPAEQQTPPVLPQSARSSPAFAAQDGIERHPKRVALEGTNAAQERKHLVDACKALAPFLQTVTARLTVMTPTPAEALDLHGALHPLSQTLSALTPQLRLPDSS
jgi:hypothetical protein